MPSLASRVLGLAVLAAFILLFVYFFTFILKVAAIILALAVVAGLLFYVRMRLALRRFARTFQKAQEAGRTQAERPGSQAGGDVLDAEFKVKDER
ncbi:MAG: hypothetical protein ABR562_06960 [Thermoplasmatota archaeon]